MQKLLRASSTPAWLCLEMQDRSSGLAMPALLLGSPWQPSRPLQKRLPLLGCLVMLPCCPKCMSTWALPLRRLGRCLQPANTTGVCCTC